MKLMTKELEAAFKRQRETVELRPDGQDDLVLAKFLTRAVNGLGMPQSLTAKIRFSESSRASRSNLDTSACPSFKVSATNLA